MTSHECSSYISCSSNGLRTFAVNRRCHRFPPSLLICASLLVHCGTFYFDKDDFVFTSKDVFLCICYLDLDPVIYFLLLKHCACGQFHANPNECLDVVTQNVFFIQGLLEGLSADCPFSKMFLRDFTSSNFRFCVTFCFRCLRSWSSKCCCPGNTCFRLTARPHCTLTETQTTHTHTSRHWQSIFHASHFVVPQSGKTLSLISLLSLIRGNNLVSSNPITADFLPQEWLELKFHCLSEDFYTHTRDVSSSI